MKKKPLLVFDFFGVVVAEVGHAWLYDNLTKEEAIHVINNIFPLGDSGKLTELQLFTILGEYSKKTAQQVIDEWMERGNQNIKTINFIKSNHDKYHIVLLSNVIRDYIERFFVRDHLDELFDIVFISSDLQLAKPDPAIFIHVLEHVPFTYSKAIMLDDNENNIKAARSVGMEGIVFTNMDEAAKEINHILLK